MTPTTLHAVAWGRSRGWLHRPAAETPRQEPVLMFGPHGAEDLCARHSLACLADQLAHQGHWVLRVDLPGTTDALGSLTDPALWPEWIDAGVDALRLLLAQAQTPTACVLGHRLGALVALACVEQASQQGLTVPRLALLAPVLQGRQHLRELRTLADPGATGLQVTGIAWGDELQSALSAVDATTRPPPPGVAQVLVGLAQRSKAWTQFEALWAPATQLTTVPYDDLDQHIGNPLFSRPPVALWQALAEWLHQPHPALDAPANTHGTCATAPPLPLPSARLADTGFVETGLLIPGEAPMAAVLCEATASPAHPAAGPRPVVILCNTGRNPHHGWSRSWVDLARTLAQNGCHSLRFDLPGVGDSLPLPQPPQELLYNDQMLPHLQRVVDHLSHTHPSHPLVLVGTCSGGYLAFHHARTDPRIRHLLLVNVQKFVWVPGTSLEAVMRSTTRSAHAYGQLALQADTWKRLLQGQVNWQGIAAKFGHMAWARLQTLGRRLRRATLRWLHAPQADTWPTDPHERVLEGFARMAQRGTRVTVVYSEDDGGRDEFAHYFGPQGQRFTRLPHTRMTLVAGADHLLTAPDARRVMHAEVLQACRALM
ncbi:alpha/beta hydrolase family protein [Hydrogenophaga soli]